MRSEVQKNEGSVRMEGSDGDPCAWGWGGRAILALRVTEHGHCQEEAEDLGAKDFLPFPRGLGPWGGEELGLQPAVSRSFPWFVTHASVLWVGHSPERKKAFQIICEVAFSILFHLHLVSQRSLIPALLASFWLFWNGACTYLEEHPEGGSFILHFFYGTALWGAWKTLYSSLLRQELAEP